MSDVAPSTTEQWLDEILPNDLAWRELVRSYPRTAMGIAAAAGFWIGLRHGPAILQAVSEYAGRTVSQQIDEFLGQER